MAPLLTLDVSRTPGLGVVGRLEFLLFLGTLILIALELLQDVPIVFAKPNPKGPGAPTGAPTWTLIALLVPILV